MKYRLKPVDAFRWSGSDAQLNGIDWLTEKDRSRITILPGGYMEITQPTQVSAAPPGWWVVKSQHGLAVYAHEVFRLLFEEVPEHG